MANTADEAREVVSLSKFPPVAARGQGSPSAGLAHGLSSPAEYVAGADESVLAMMQIETVTGVKDFDEICQVDVVFIGPDERSYARFARLHASYCNWAESVSLEAINKVGASAKRHGEKLSIRSVDEEAAR